MFTTVKCLCCGEESFTEGDLHGLRCGCAPFLKCYRCYRCIGCCRCPEGVQSLDAKMAERAAARQAHAAQLALGNAGSSRRLQAGEPAPRKTGALL